MIPSLSRRLSLAVAVVAAGLASLPSAADALPYTVHSCKTPDGALGGTTPPWQVVEGAFESILTARSGCPGGPFELEMLSSKAHPADHSIKAIFKAPDGTAITSYQLWRSVQLANPYNFWIHERTAGGTYIKKEECQAAEGCTSKGNPASPLSGSNLVQRPAGSGVAELQLLLTCGLADTSTSTCPATAPGARLQLHRADVTLEDPHRPGLVVPPNASFLTTSQSLIGPQQVWIWAKDRGSGVHEVLFKVDGAVVGRSTIDSNGGNCRPPYRSATPCKTEVAGLASFDTASIPDGEHQLTLSVTDAAGWESQEFGSYRIRTANAQCNPDPAVESLDMRVGLAGRNGRRARAITTRYGRRLRVRGALFGPGSTPVAGAPVCVSARDSFAGASLRTYRTFATGAKGRFSHVLRRGPSRRVYFVHRTAGGAVVDSILVRVRAPVALRGRPRSLANGQTLTLSGGLRARPFPRRGLLVELQARRGTGWQTFATTRTNRRGRFRYRYTFSRTQGVQRYQLRARVPKQPTYPYAAGASRPLRVQVHG